MRLRKDRASTPGVVASVEQQTAEADALARIAGQARLMDPRTNPAVRGHADQLRNDQQIRTLNAENSRLVRRIRVQDGRAAYAEKTLEAIQLARQASSPARSVLALHTNKRKYMRLALGASLVLAAGSSMGVEAAADALDAPFGSGYIAEVGLTGLSTAALSYLAHLTEHRGKLKKGTWQFRSLWTLIVAPPLISVACNLGTWNVVGAFCAISAVAFALLGCVVADRSSEAMQARAAEVSGQDEDELRATAMGEDLFTAVPDQPAGLTRAERDAEELDEPFAASRIDAERHADEPTTGPELFSDEALAEWLNEPPEEGVTSSPPAPDADGPQGAALEAPNAPDGPGGHIDSEGGHIDSDLPDRRVLPAAQARRAIGASTRQRIAEYVTRHPKASHRQVAEDLDLSEETVKRHRRTLRTDGADAAEPRVLTDEHLMVRLTAMIAAGELPEVPSIRAVQDALGLGFSRAKRVMELAGLPTGQERDGGEVAA